ncbi:MAG: methionyl-tRNA formyltransferase [Pyrinomonadaceae bacterium]
MKIVFMGTPQAAVASLQRCLMDGHEIVAVYTQPDRPAGRGNKIRHSPVKEFAVENALTVLQPERIKTPDAFDQFAKLGADIAVVVAYGRILPESFLDAFPKGAVNVHFSLLPKYRGAAPVNWAIVHGETVTGVTTMKMDSGLDTGDILLQREAEIGDAENSIELMDRLAILGAELLSETLSKFDEIIPLRQDHERATYAPILKKEDGRFAWTQTSGEIARRVRGFQPFPGTYTDLRGKKLTIWDAAAMTDLAEDLRPGDVLEAAGDSLLVACGENTALLIREIQLEGKRRMSARDFLNGVHLRPGDRLI